MFEGRLTLADFNPMPKNPIIANFFTQIGYAEELGSGLRNLEKYARPFLGADPVLQEGDVFVARIPRNSETLGAAATVATAAKAAKAATRLAIMALLKERGSLSAVEAAEGARISPKTAAKYLKALVGEGLAEPDGNVRTRRYYWTGSPGR